MNSKLSDTRQNAQETKEKRKMGRETLGKFFYDLAKTTFAVMVVGNTAASPSRNDVTDGKMWSVRAGTDAFLSSL